MEKNNDQARFIGEKSDIFRHWTNDIPRLLHCADIIDKIDLSLDQLDMIVKTMEWVGHDSVREVKKMADTLRDDLIELMIRNYKLMDEEIVRAIEENEDGDYVDLDTYEAARRFVPHYKEMRYHADRDSDCWHREFGFRIVSESDGTALSVGSFEQR